MKKKKRYEAHGMSTTPFYRRWNGMMRRCYSESFKQYHNYGGRGIIVCERWHLFSNFKEDMYDSFKEELELDRVDNNGNYCKENCDWVTHRENSNNRTTSVIFNGESTADASIRLGGDLSLVSSRMCRGWSMEKAFTYPYDATKAHFPKK